MPVSQNLGGALVGGYQAAAMADINRKKLMEEQRQAMATQFKDNFERAIGLVKDSAVALDKIRTNAEGGEQSKQYQNAQSVYGKMATTTIQSTLDLAQKMEAQGVLPQGSVQQYAAMFGAAGNITPADVEIGLKAKESGDVALAQVPAQEQVINAQSQASMKQQANASYLARQVPNVINFQNPDNLDDVVGVDINAPDARKKVDELIKAGYIRATTGGSGSSQILPIPENAQQDFTNSFAALKLLDVMEGKISTSGRFEGPFQEALAFFGINPNAVEFNVARNQFKLMAQSLIKGTPSNFDVNTVIATLPALMSPETTNQSRINLARDLFTQLIKDKIGFYKGTNRTIPNEIIDQAKEYGIDVAGVTPTDGNTFDRGGAMRILLNKSSDADLITMLNSEDVSSSAKEQIASEMERRISSGR